MLQQWQIQQPTSEGTKVYQQYRGVWRRPKFNWVPGNFQIQAALEERTASAADVQFSSIFQFPILYG